MTKIRTIKIESYYVLPKFRKALGTFKCSKYFS